MLDKEVQNFQCQIRKSDLFRCQIKNSPFIYLVIFWEFLAKYICAMLLDSVFGWLFAGKYVLRGKWNIHALQQERKIKSWLPDSCEMKRTREYLLVCPSSKLQEMLIIQRKTLTHHVSMQIIMFVKQKDYWWLHWFILKTYYYLFSCFFYCVYCFLLLCDIMWWNFICL